jgi:hypothetical protein
MAVFDRLRLPSVIEESEPRIPDNFVNARRDDLPSITASSQVINLKKATDRSMLADRPYIEWQREVWGYFDSIGEVSFAFTLLSNIGSRVKLYPAVDLDPGSPPTSIFDINKRREQLSEAESVEEKAVGLSLPDDLTPEVEQTLLEIWRELQESSGGIPGMLRAYFQNMSIAGECYLAKIDGNWSVRSTEEIVLDRGSKLPSLRTLRTSSGLMGKSTGQRTLPASTYIGRIWNAHPRFSGEPHSSMLAVRELCDELLQIQRMTRIIERSQMLAPLLFLPDSISSAASTPALGLNPEEGEIDFPELEQDPLEQEILDTIIAALSNEASMSTLMPPILRGPADHGDKIKTIPLSRDLTKEFTERADSVLDRILQGLDTAKEVVSGLQQISYRNAEIITEQLFRSHIEPPVLNFVTSVNSMLVRAALKRKHPELSNETLSKLGLWYSKDGVVIDTDSKQMNDYGYENFLISGDAWRQRSGYSDNEAPSEDEIATRLAIKNPLPPELAGEVLKHAIKSVLDAQQESNQQSALPPEALEALGIGGGQPPVEEEVVEEEPVLEEGEIPLEEEMGPE